MNNINAASNSKGFKFGLIILQVVYSCVNFLLFCTFALKINSINSFISVSDLWSNIFYYLLKDTVHDTAVIAILLNLICSVIYVFLSVLKKFPPYMTSYVCIANSFLCLIIEYLSTALMRNNVFWEYQIIIFIPLTSMILSTVFLFDDLFDFLRNKYIPRKPQKTQKYVEALDESFGKLAKLKSKQDVQARALNSAIDNIFENEEIKLTGDEAIEFAASKVIPNIASDHAVEKTEATVDAQTVDTQAQKAEAQENIGLAKPAADSIKPTVPAENGPKKNQVILPDNDLGLASVESAEQPVPALTDDEAKSSDIETDAESVVLQLNDNRTETSAELAVELEEIPEGQIAEENADIRNTDIQNVIEEPVQTPSAEDVTAQIEDVPASSEENPVQAEELPAQAKAVSTQAEEISAQAQDAFPAAMQETEKTPLDPRSDIEGVDSSNPPQEDVPVIEGNRKIHPEKQTEKEETKRKAEDILNGNKGRVIFTRPPSDAMIIERKETILEQQQRIMEESENSVPMVRESND